MCNILYYNRPSGILSELINSVLYLYKNTNPMHVDSNKRASVEVVAKQDKHFYYTHLYPSIL